MSDTTSTTPPQPQPKRPRKKSPVFVKRWEVMEDLEIKRPETIDRMVERGEIPASMSEGRKAS